MPWNHDLWYQRYRRPGEEAPGDTMARVSSALAKDTWENSFKSFMDILERGEFVPGGRIIANAGMPGGMLLNCFNVPVPDSRHDIFRSLADGVEVLAHGGGVGFNFSNLRAAGAALKSTGGVSQGPVPFIDMFDQAFGLISRSYKKRQAAAIALLSSDHPDVIEFIKAKKSNGDGVKRWTSMNVSVSMSKSMVAGLLGSSPSDAVLRTWNTILDCAYECGDPGLVFLSRARDACNVEPREDTITGVNPCGEVPLFDYGACCLGSVNLSNLVVGGRVDLNRLSEVVRVGVDMLTSVLYQTTYPGERFRHVGLKYRRIGLGMTGVAHAMIKCGLTYGSAEAISWLEMVCETIAVAAYAKSHEMAKDTGTSVPLRSDGKGFIQKYPTMDQLFHAGLLAVAPTGATSMLLNTSSGVEPIFNVETRRSDRGVERTIKDPLWGQYPAHLFKTSLEVSPQEHLRTLDAVSRLIDGSVSKTINLPENVSREQFNKFMLEALGYKNIKGLTVYRDRSLPGQVVALDQPVMTGKIYEIETPSGKIYVPVGQDARGRIKQVFIHLHKPGGEEFALASALGRVISIALQEGAPVDRIIDTMHGIGSGQVVWTSMDGRSTPILSAPDAIAKALAVFVGRDDVLQGRPGVESAVLVPPNVPVYDMRGKDITLPTGTDTCPNCCIPFTRTEGCMTCKTCGLSFCDREG